jgi:FlaA1/EpsC-like NDP-sugar epimerase
MHIFVKKNYRASRTFSALLRLGILLRTTLALLKKYRGAVALVALDYATVAFGVLLGTKLLMGSWLGLPDWDYPSAVLVPPIVVVALLAVLSAYAGNERRSARQIVIAMPAILIGLSSLTYFFKEFPASRAVVIAVTVTSSVLLLVNRFLLRITDRVRWGGINSANPMLRPTLIVGTSEEAVRIALLLKRPQFLRRFEVVGFIDDSLVHLGDEVISGTRILGDTNMMGKVVRDKRISEVIFASDAVPYTDMLAIMQRVSRENLSSRVNFNMVPTASEVLLGKHRIELLSPTTEGSVAFMPVEYNLQRISHRMAKRLLDLAVSAAVLPVVACSALIRASIQRRELLAMWTKIFRGEFTLVGVAGGEARSAFFAKPGLTSLAAVAAPRDVRDEDILQFDQYYARNHTFGMDCEILLKTMLFRGEKR